MNTGLIETKDKVAIVEVEGFAHYPVVPPFGPDVRFPELKEFCVQRECNPVYAAVRSAWFHLGFDAENYGTPQWNPLSEIVHPGDSVVVKPNLVYHYHPLGRFGLEAQLVHGSVARAVIDYVALALQRKGDIIVADSPVIQADFERTTTAMGIDSVVEHCRMMHGIQISLLDLRRRRRVFDYKGFTRPRIESLPGDPKGYSLIDLGEQSAFSPLDGMYWCLRSTEIVRDSTQDFHKPGMHRYMLPNTVLQADAIISIGKLKTHNMAGLTGSLKNVVGMCADKHSLPHHRVGIYSDEHPNEYSTAKKVRASVLKRLVQLAKLWPAVEKLPGYKQRVNAIVSGTSGLFLWGTWYGNDTLWRMVIDLLRIVYNGVRLGLSDCQSVPRNLFVVDGVIGGEGQGPVGCKPRTTGLILAGTNPVAMDMVQARLMGFDSSKIPVICAGNMIDRWHVQEQSLIACQSNADRWRALWYLPVNELLRYEPPPGWVGYIELVA